MMVKQTLVTVLGGSAFVVGASLVAATAYATGGCVASPENPTWILGGLGAVAAGAPWLRVKLRERRNKRQGR